jgi:hypothetical protein
MLTAEAHVKTQDPSRYLTQLCHHARQVHRMRHRPRNHGADGQPPPRVEAVEYSESSGMISFGWGRCTMQATPGTLTLRAEAEDQGSLQRVQDIVTRDIERFGKRRQLTITWQPTNAHSAQPGQNS